MTVKKVVEINTELQQYRESRAAADQFGHDIAEAINHALSSGAAFGDVYTVLQINAMQLGQEILDRSMAEQDDGDFDDEDGPDELH